MPHPYDVPEGFQVRGNVCGIPFYLRRNFRASQGSSEPTCFEPGAEGLVGYGLIVFLSLPGNAEAAGTFHHNQLHIGLPSDLFYGFHVIVIL